MNQTPWLGHYDPGVPATLAPYPSRTLLDYVADTARDAAGPSGAPLQRLDAHLRRRSSV